MNRIYSKRFKSESEVAEVIQSLEPPFTFINCNFSGLDLQRFKLDNCVFDSCVMASTVFGSAMNSKFYSCNLKEADFSNADLSGTSLLECQADRLKLSGAKISVSCEFFGGLKTSRESDIWKLIYLIALVDSPYRERLLELIPPQGKLLIETQFARIA